MNTQNPNQNWFASAVEAIAYRDLGLCECQGVSQRLACCSKSIRTRSSASLQREMALLTSAINAYALRENASELEFVELKTRLERAKSKYWWGNSVGTFLADQLSKYCHDHGVCAHKVRRLVNSGVIEIDSSSSSPITFPSPWLHWFDAFVFAFVCACLLILSVSTFTRAPSDEVGSLIAAATLSATASLVALWGLSGPIWRLVVRQEMKLKLASFVYVRPESVKPLLMGNFGNS